MSTTQYSSWRRTQSGVSGRSSRPFGAVEKAVVGHRELEAISFRDGKPFSLCALTIMDGRIAKMNFLTDPERLAALDFTLIGE